MSVSQEQVESFFKSGGTDEAAVTKMREVIPEPAPVETAPEEVTQPAEKPVEAAKPAEDKPIPEAKFVPLEALQEERAEKKELKQRLEQFQAWQAQVQEQLKGIPKAQAEQAPDPNMDPLGYQSWAIQQLGATVQQQQQWQRQQEQNAQQQAQLTRTTQWAQGQEQAFRATQPAYDDAYKFIAAARGAEYDAMGFTSEMKAQALYQDQMSIVNLAAQQGRNPAQLLWDLAAQRGFKAGAKSTGDPNAQAKIAAGLQATPKIDKGGSTADGEMTAKDLANINDPAEFEKAWGKLFKKG